MDAFQKLLSAPSGWRPALLGIAFNEIGSEEATKLEEAFTEEEIWTSISGLNGDKALGPNGFPLAFWSFSWDFVKNGVLDFFKDFHKHSRFVKNLNATILVLIPRNKMWRISRI